MGMHSEWTDAQRALATPGCAIEVEIGEGDDQGMATGEIVSADTDDDGLWLNVRITHDDGTQEVVGLDEQDADPDTLRAPTMATLNRMAVESFGEGARVIDGHLLIGVPGRVMRYFEVRTADFYASFMSVHADDAARECARWLAARGR